MSFFFFNDTATTEIYTLSLHDALPILPAERRDRPWRGRGAVRAGAPRDQGEGGPGARAAGRGVADRPAAGAGRAARSEEHTSELQSRQYLVCRLLLEKKIIQICSCSGR